MTSSREKSEFVVDYFEDIKDKRHNLRKETKI